MKKKHTTVYIETYPKLYHLCEEIFADSKEMKKHIHIPLQEKVKYDLDECDFVGKSEVFMLD